MTDVEVQFRKAMEDGELGHSDSDASEAQNTSRKGRETKVKRKSRYDILDEKWNNKFNTINSEMSGLNSKLDSILQSLSCQAQSQEGDTLVAGQAQRHRPQNENKARSKDSDAEDDILSVLADGNISESESVLDCEQNQLPLSPQVDSLSAEARKCLFDIFGDDARVKRTERKSGIVIDESQKEVLDETLHCKTPNFLTSFNEENYDLFPVDESTEKFLEVPSLDSLIEGCLVKRHGMKASYKNKAKSLCSQPSKMVEKIAYKGQQAARLGIVMQLYVQQSLGNLLENLQRNDIDKDKCITSVKDIFAMTTKGLDQLGRTAAFNHIIRRTVSMTDSGLYELPDANEFTSLPLTSEGVFGNGLEALLKSRKEKKKQLDELVPDLRKRELKRKPLVDISHHSEPKRRYFEKFPSATATCSSADYSYNNTFAVPVVPRESHQVVRGRTSGYTGRGKNTFPGRSSSRGRFGRRQ